MAIQKGPIGSSIETAEIAAGAVTSAKLDTNIAIAGDLTVDTNTLYVDSTNNRVGIGTASPPYALSVSSTSSNTITAINTASNVSRFCFAENATPSNTYTNIEGDARSSGYLAFRTNDAERMRIDSSGNVGIGASTPGAKLDVSTTTPAPNVAIWTSQNQNLTLRDDSAYAAGVGGALTFEGKYNTAGSYSVFGYIRGSKTDASDGGFQGGIVYGTRSGDHVFVTNGSGLTNGTTERMRIDSSGNVGIGTSNPSFKVDLKMSSSARTGGLVIRRSLNDSHQLGLWTDSGEMYFDAITDNVNSAGITVFRRSLNTGASFTESMRIDSSGSLLVGTTTNSGYKVSLYADNSVMETRVLNSVARQHISFYNGSYVGSIVTSGSSTSYNTTSDYRLKENVVEVTDGIDRVKLLKPSKFNFIAHPDKTVDGFLAHEVQDVVPEAIYGTKDAMKTEEYEVTPAVLDDEGNVVTEAVMGTREVPEYQGIDQSKLVPLLTAALQEAITEIESLKSRLDAAGL